MSLVKAIVPVLVGRVSVAAPLVIDEITGDVRVLFVSVVVDDAVTVMSLVSATVPVASGNVIVRSAVGSVT